MESVGQNATLFPKSQISANFIFAQVYYLRQIERLVSKVPKVSIVTFGGPLRRMFILYIIISTVIQLTPFLSCSPAQPRSASHYKPSGRFINQSAVRCLVLTIDAAVISGPALAPTRRGLLAGRSANGAAGWRMGKRSGSALDGIWPARGNSVLLIYNANYPCHAPPTTTLFPQDCHGSGIELLGVAAARRADGGVDRGAIKCPLAGDNRFFGLNGLPDGKVSERPGKVVHDRFFSANQPPISVDDDDIIRHEPSESFDVSSLNGRRPPIGNAPYLSLVIFGQTGCHTSPKNGMPTQLYAGAELSPTPRISRTSSSGKLGVIRVQETGCPRNLRWG